MLKVLGACGGRLLPPPRSPSHSRPPLQSQGNARHPGKAGGFSLLAEILEASCPSDP